MKAHRSKSQGLIESVERHVHDVVYAYICGRPGVYIECVRKLVFLYKRTGFENEQGANRKKLPKNKTKPREMVKRKTLRISASNSAL